MKRTRPTSLRRSSGAGVSACYALILAVLHLFFFCYRAKASIFIVAICKDGILAVADSRFTLFDNDTGRAVAYADGLDKIIHLRAALLAETGQGFIGDERFD